METILLIAVISTLNIVCFFIGAKVGQTVANGKELEAPTIKTPIEVIREYQESKAVRKELDKLETIMRNTERYDGTANGQEDVPR